MIYKLTKKSKLEERIDKEYIRRRKLKSEFNKLKNAKPKRTKSKKKLKPLADKKKQYKEFLKSDYWKYVRINVLERDKNKCVKCSSTVKLHVHHLTYKNHGSELSNLSDLITLCCVCHKKEHNIK